MTNRNVIGLPLVLVALLLVGCSALWNSGGERRGVSSSLVDFLYPDGKAPPPDDGVKPRLSVPLRVGLAFVPETGGSETPGLSEAQKNDLLERVKRSFADREYISTIEVIPDTYLRRGKGFDTVGQVARLYGVDVISLVSYDQVVHGEDSKASILYWTIVGAYFIKGNKNDVQTFVDTAVFDVPTRKLLFRAPGTDQIEARSTLVNNAETLRETRSASFENAMADMTTHLAAELDRFRERIKQDGSVEVAYRPGSGGDGGGAFDLPLLGLLAAGLFAAARRD